MPSCRWSNVVWKTVWKKLWGTIKNLYQNMKTWKIRSLQSADGSVNVTFQSVKSGRFETNASSFEYSTDPVKCTTEVRRFTCAEFNS